jgi:hypothetical protein
MPSLRWGIAVAMPCPKGHILRNQDENTRESLEKLMVRNLPDGLLKDAKELRTQSMMALVEHRNSCRLCQITLNN